MRLLRITTLLLLTFISITSIAASRYWISSSASNWNNTANWSATSGGAGGASVPSFSDIAYFDANGTGTCNLDMNASVDAVIMSAGTFNISTFNFSVSGTSNSTFSGGTVNGSSTFNIHPSGTASVTFSGTTFNPAVDVISPRIHLNGSTFNGISSFEKTGANSDVGTGGNTFGGNCTIKNSGSRYFMLGNNGDDVFSANLDIINSGSYVIYLAYNNSTTTIAGDLNVTNSGSAIAIGISYAGASSVSVSGNCTVTANSSANANIYLGHNGSFDVSGNLDISNGGSANSSIYLANGTSSSSTIGGISTIVNNDTATSHRIYLGNQGDVTFNGVLNIVNNSNANSSQIYCNSGANSVNLYNENIVVEVTQAGSDGILFGGNNGQGTLASGKTITIGANGYTSGDLEFRNFTQTGSTAQTLSTLSTGTARIYCFDSDWGGNVDFSSPRILTRGTTYHGTCKLEKTGAANDLSYGGNTFMNNVILNNSGSNYLSMGYNGTDDFQGDLTLNNTGSNNIYIAHRSPGTTNIAGNLTINNTSTNNNGQIIIANDSISQVYITGNTTVTNSGAGVVKRVYLGTTGDITFNGSLTIHNSSSSTNSQVYLNYNSYSSNTFNNNILVESSNANSDGILFGYHGGSGIFAAGKTITIGGGGFIAGNLYFRNFTQNGTTAQNLHTTGTSSIVSYDSDWGGNIDFVAGRITTQGTTYNGTVVMEKTGAGNDGSSGGNTFKANTELKNSGSGYFLMGNGASDDFQGNLTIRNTGTNSFYLANNSAGNHIANDLAIYNSGRYVYLNNNAISSTSIGGNCLINQSGSSSSGTYFNDDGTLTLTGTLDITNSSSGSSYIYVSSTSTSSATIDGNTTITNNGTGTTSRFYLGSNGAITFNGNLNIHNNSASTNSQVYLNYSNSSNHNNYNGNIVVESSIAGCDGVLFGSVGGAGILAATKTLTIGGAGFVSGQLYLRNFTQTGATAHSLTATGTGTIYSFDSDWGGNVEFTAPTLFVRGTNFQGTALLEKTGSTNDAGTGGNTFHNSVTFKNSGTGYLMLGSGTSDTYLSNVTLENVGSNDIYFARSGAGHSITGNLTINNTGSDGDIFVTDITGSTLSITGNTSVVNSGAGTYHRIFLGNRGSISFGGTLDISNSSTATNSAIYLNHATGSNNTYAENISIENTNAASDGVLFGTSGGTGVLAASKTVSIKAGGFIAGQLYFRNFTQSGTTAQTITVTDDADLLFNNSDWGGIVTFKSPRMFVTGSNFHNNAYFEKTGSGNDNSAGGNTFTGTVEFKNSGSGYLYFGSGSPSTFLSSVILTNTGTNNIIFARSGSGHSIAGNLFINNTSAGGQVIIADQSSSSLTIGGATVVTNSGGGTNHRVYLGNSGDITFNGNINISNSSDATNSAVYIGASTVNSHIVMNGDLIVENTNAASDGIYINAQSATLANGKTIGINTGGFVAGVFRIRNLTQAGSAAVSLTLTGTGNLQSWGSNWGGNVSFKAPRLYTRNSIFNGTTFLEKTGATDDQCYGGNTFKGVTSLRNSSAGYYLMMSASNPDTYEDNLSMENFGDDDIYIANTAAGVHIQGNLTVNNTGRNIYIANGSTSSVTIDGDVLVLNQSALASASVYLAGNGSVNIGGICNLANSSTGNTGQIIMANGASSSATIAGKTTVINQNAGTTKRIYLGNQGHLTLNGDLEITNAATATNSQIYCNNYSSSSSSFNGNITVSASGTNCDGIYFGASGGASTLSAGHTLSIGGAGYTDGHLYLRNFTQSGGSAQNLNLTNVAYLYLYNSVWNGSTNFTAPSLYLRQNTFNAAATLEKTGAIGISNYGGNTYNGNASITNSGSSYYRLASTAPNDYNGNVLFTKSGSGNLYPTYNQHSTITGNLSINTNSSFLIGVGSNAWFEFDGTSAQSINNTGAANTITIRRMMTNNSANEISLNTPITVDRNINLSNGNLITTATNILTMTDNAAVDAVSDNAYVAGPMKKVGNDAFTFPVGGTDSYGSSHYAAIGISAPSSTSHSFTAEYHAAGHANATTFSAPLTKVSLVEYWDLTRTIGSGNINVYLYWGDGTRSGIGNLADLRVAHWNGTTWEDKGNNGTSGSAANGGIAVNGINTFSPFTFGTINNVENPLPIKLLNFDVTKEDQSVRVDWSTASETNNDYFIIERTDDFKNIETVQTVKGAGNSNQTLKYYIYDNQPLNGTSYYRLTQVDFNGEQEVFEWKAVNFSLILEPQLSVYPNPSKGTNTNIKLSNMSGATQLDVLDMTGRIIYSQSLDLIETSNLIPLNLDLSAGIYSIRSVNNNSIITKQFIVN